MILGLMENENKRHNNNLIDENILSTISNIYYCPNSRIHIPTYMGRGRGEFMIKKQKIKMYSQYSIRKFVKCDNGKSFPKLFL
jgi:hypothetical protein